jgi:hypothetical protein
MKTETWIRNFMHLEHVFRPLDMLVGWGIAQQARVLSVQFQIGSLEFFIDLIFQAALLPWGLLSRNGYEYQEYLMEVNAVGTKGWRPCHFHLPILWKSWKPQFPGDLKSSPGLYLFFLLDLPSHSYWLHVIPTHFSVYSRRLWFDGIFL